MKILKLNDKVHSELKEATKDYKVTMSLLAGHAIKHGLVYISEHGLLLEGNNAPESKQEINAKDKEDHFSNNLSSDLYD